MQTDFFELEGRHICISRCKKKTGAVIRTITVRRSLQIDVIARNDATNEAIKKFLTDNWYLIKDGRGQIDLEYIYHLLKERDTYPVNERYECPSGPFVLYKVCPTKTSMIDVYAYRQLEVSSPTYFDVKQIYYQRSAIILFPANWKQSKIKKWINDSKRTIDEQFLLKYGTTFVEKFLPEELYSLVSDWKIIIRYESLPSMSYRLDKRNKKFYLKLPLDYSIRDAKDWLNNNFSRIKQEIDDKNINSSGIIGDVRDKKSNGCSFAISPSKSAHSKTSHNASNSFWRGSGWIRDITETPSERAANVREGIRVQRTSPISSFYSKASDLRGLGVIDSSGRLTFIEKKNDAWIEDKNN